MIIFTDVSLFFLTHIQTQGITLLWKDNNQISIYVFIYFILHVYIFYIFPSPFCSLSLKQTDNSILTSSEEEYNRETVSDHHELCFKKVRRGEVVGLQRASSFSWQKRYSSMAHPGRRDHRQSQFVCPNLTAGAERAMLTRCGPSCECLFGEIT